MCDLDQACYIFLKRLKYLDNRQYCKNPSKAHAHPKFSIGVREIHRKILYSNIKIIFIANDINKDELLEKIHINFNLEEICKNKGIPFISCLSKKILAKIFKKSTIVSCISILSIEGAETEFESLLKIYKIYKPILEQINQNSLFP
ncbi:Ribosomal protein L7Ae/L30e/S12e/Gadd45 domain-containing protein [Strongyloides ratti]|uniref:Ribosomal protein L7Ae/L30e/S12e/Gadd45 domain-containing protein n=1 Tax=Strongyloides ratti TaxID=34506 RepID=A0A090MWM2_STRRB|nr:Ribosomal protein L7Ae/L30e/S12e/Gadd45 domain-containing protein [Strongyloides ratti]CEF63929.1 Ribosomal protein L7Ae/L30e/S12e/Gadd45 domain-containing protein [Strongyloides ratti]